MNLEIIHPFLLLLGDPQLWCQLLKSPAMMVFSLGLPYIFSKFLSSKFLFGAMYVDMRRNFCLDTDRFNIVVRINLFVLY